MSTRLHLAFPALALVAIAAWEVLAAHRDATDVPDDAAWDRAAAAVRAEYRAGDLITFAPGWNDPVGRLHLGDLISLDDAARADGDRYARIWELAIRGARAPETRGLAPTVDRTIDGIAVRRYDRAPAKVLADFRDRVGTAKVEGNRARGPSVELQEVGFAPHKCILVAPAGADPVTLTFPAVPLGRHLVGYAGIADVFTRRDQRAPGRIQVAIDDVLRADRSLDVEAGWVRFAADTDPTAPKDVVVTLSSAAPGRLICFTLEARE